MGMISSLVSVIIKNQDSKFVRQGEPVPRRVKLVRRKIIMLLCKLNCTRVTFQKLFVGLIILFMGMGWITPESLIADDFVASPSSVADLINPTFNEMLSWSPIMPDGHLPGGPVILNLKTGEIMIMGSWPTLDEPPGPYNFFPGRRNSHIPLADHGQKLFGWDPFTIKSTTDTHTLKAAVGGAVQVEIIDGRPYVWVRPYAGNINRAGVLKEVVPGSGQFEMIDEFNRKAGGKASPQNFARLVNGLRQHYEKQGIPKENVVGIWNRKDQHPPSKSRCATHQRSTGGPRRGKGQGGAVVAAIFLYLNAQRFAEAYGNYDYSTMGEVAFDQVNPFPFTSPWEYARAHEDCTSNAKTTSDYVIGTAMTPYQVIGGSMAGFGYITAVGAECAFGWTQPRGSLSEVWSPWRPQY